MKVAGRVLIISRGSYSASVTYKPLDMVTYNYTSWICKQECTGIEPTNTSTQYWHHVTDIGLVNNMETVAEGFALDARLGRLINNELTTNRTNMEVMSREFSSLSTVVNELLGTNVAEDYDDEETYAVDDYVIYYNNLYKCITAVTTAEEFDEDKWAKCYIMDEINDKIAEVVEDIASGEVDANLGDLYDNMANEFSKYSTYIAGDYVIKGGSLYQCVEGCTGEWDATKWAQTNIATEIGDVTELIQTESGRISDLEGSTIESSAIAEPFDQTKSYSEGDYVIYEGEMYRASTNHTPGSFEGGWTKKSVTSVISDLDDVVSGINSNEETDRTNISTHTADKNNPHEVTKAQVGLGNVPNVSTNDQTVTYGNLIIPTEMESGETMSTAFVKIASLVKAAINHIYSTDGHVTDSDKERWNAKAEDTLATTTANGLMSASDKVTLNTLSNQLSNNGDTFYFDYQDGKYGFNTSSDRGADTFYPFNQGGNAEDLYNALQYSGFVTEDMTYDDMIQALTEYFPDHLEWNGLDLSKTDWDLLNGTMSVTAGSKISVNAPASTNVYISTVDELIIPAYSYEHLTVTYFDNYGSTNKFNVYVSEDHGTTWSSAIYSDSATPMVGKTANIDMSDYAGKRIKLRFRYQNTYSGGSKICSITRMRIS